jgi:hypothetical protein
MGRVPFGPLFQRVVFPSGHFLPMLLVDQGLLVLIRGCGVMKPLDDAHPAFKTSGWLHLIVFPRMMSTLDFCGTWRGSVTLWEVCRELSFEFGNFTGAICESCKKLMNMFAFTCCMCIALSCLHIFLNTLSRSGLVGIA